MRISSFLQLEATNLGYSTHSSCACKSHDTVLVQTPIGPEATCCTQGGGSSPLWQDSVRTSPIQSTPSQGGAAATCGLPQDSARAFSNTSQPLKRRGQLPLAASYRRTLSEPSLIQSTPSQAGAAATCGLPQDSVRNISNTIYPFTRRNISHLRLAARTFSNTIHPFTRRGKEPLAASRAEFCQNLLYRFHPLTRRGCSTGF